MPQSLSIEVNTRHYSLQDIDFRIAWQGTLHTNDALLLPNFLKRAAIAPVRKEGQGHKRPRYYTVSTHNIYLDNSDSRFPNSHLRNARFLQ